MTEERVRERAPMGYGGASIAFIAVYGAILGALALVPIFPYFGGGGFIPLSVIFTAIGPLVLGPIGGIIAAVIGGFIGMFVSPAMFPLGLLDVLLTGILPALFVALMIITFVFLSKPSISTNNWFSVCSLSSCPPPMPAPLILPTASNSSINTRHGAFFFAVLNKSRTLAAPVPTKSSTNVEPEV